MSADAGLPLSLDRIGKGLSRPVANWLRDWRMRLAARNQKRYCGTYVAVTGSCGKSSTCDLTARLLSLQASVVHHGSSNTQRTVRKVIAGLRNQVDFVVQEVGLQHRDSIRDSVRGLRVDMAVVTAVGTDHWANYKHDELDFRDAIARDKGALMEQLHPGGVAVLNADDPRVRAMAARTTARVVLYGESPDADVRAENVAARYPERLSFDLVIGQNRRAVRTRFVSTLMLPTLLSALSVVHAAEHDVDAAVAALAKMEPMPDRLGVHAGSDGKTYIVDTTKAPHWSVLLLIKEIRAWQLPDLVVVLGDVSDVRREKARIYRTLLRSFSEFAMEVVATGEAARQVDELRSQGTSNIVAAPTALDVARHLATRPPCVVLLKANSSSQTWRAAAPAVSAQLRQERRRL